MSNAFHNFLSNNGQGTSFKGYSHATNLYVNGNFKNAPKFGFLYFVSFNINAEVIGNNSAWYNKGKDYVAGMLVKRIDMPKFKISTETVNQYNRKTKIQTKIDYEAVSVEFHDDNSEITNNLWTHYYKYYYADSNYGDAVGGSDSSPAYGDTKYNERSNAYGFDTPKQIPFFRSIDIYVLHQGNFTKITLVNPIISSWDHDSLEQAGTSKILQNKMSLVYEDVFYNYGVIKENEDAQGYSAVYYDNEPGSLSVGGNIENSRPDNVVNQAAVFGPPQDNPRPIPQYPSPQPLEYSQSQLNKSSAQMQPSYATPRPIGSGTVGLGQARRPSGFSISGISIWSGYGGLHGKAVVQAGPIRLVLKK